MNRVLTLLVACTILFVCQCTIVPTHVGSKNRSFGTLEWEPDLTSSVPTEGLGGPGSPSLVARLEQGPPMEEEIELAELAGLGYGGMTGSGGLRRGMDDDAGSSGDLGDTAPMTWRKAGAATNAVTL